MPSHKLAQDQKLSNFISFNAKIRFSQRHPGLSHKFHNAILYPHIISSLSTAHVPSRCASLANCRRVKRWQNLSFSAAHVVAINLAAPRLPKTTVYSTILRTFSFRMCVIYSHTCRVADFKHHLSHFEKRALALTLHIGRSLTRWANLG